MRVPLLILLFTVLFIAPFVSAQENSFVFSQIKERDGLSDNVINSFLRDSRGIFWIGTFNGLNRYDGSNFLTYKKRKGVNSLVNEFVHSLCEDEKGNIWGGTANGVFCFDPRTEQFDNFPVRGFTAGRAYYKVVYDGRGNVWAAGDRSVMRFNSAQKKFIEEIKPFTNTDTAHQFRIYKNMLLVDPGGKGLWIGSTSGILYYDFAGRNFLHCYNTKGDSLFAKRTAKALCHSSSGKIWFFENDNRRLISFDPATKKILQTISVGHVVPRADGATIFEDNRQRLWFCSWTYELLLIEPLDGNKITKLVHDPKDSRSIAGQFFWAVHQDRDGTLWFGTVSGISRCNPENTIYRQFNLPDKIKELENEAIARAEQDPRDKSYWIVTASLKLFHYQPRDGKYKIYDITKAEPNSTGAMPGPCNWIKFWRDRVIIATYYGAWQLKEGQQKIEPYDYLPKGYEDFLVSEIAHEGDSMIYFNNGKKILYWNHLTGKTGIITYPKTTAVPNRTVISGLHYKKGQKMWVTSAGSHIAYRSDDSTLTRLQIVPDDPMENGVLASIDEDKKGNVWLCNRGSGLTQYDPKTGKIKVWDESDGLPLNRMHTAKLDDKDQVWSMSYNKVSVFIPGPDRFYNFNLPISESKLNYYNHLSRLENGNMIGTMNNDIVEFYPERVTAIPGKEKPQISQLSINGKEIKAVNDSVIYLRPNQNTIKLKFGILSDRSIFPYDLEYMLEGAETKWTVSTGTGEALYNSLAPGKYKFRVIARGRNNAWQSEEAHLFIRIKTPFHKTTFFRAAIAVLFTGLLFFFYRYRLAQKEKLVRLESKAQLLEKEKVIMMYDSLKQQLNPHFLFNSLTSLSGLIETDQRMAGEFLEQMSGIYRYILKNSENETVLLKDEIEFVKLYINLQQTRFKSGLKVNIEVPEDYLHYRIAPVTLQNLIENAIKHNIIDSGTPLVIDIYIEGDDYLVVKNNLQKKNVVETSNKKGLAQFISLYHYLSSSPVKIEETDKYFKISIPLI